MGIIYIKLWVLGSNPNGITKEKTASQSIERRFLSSYRFLYNKYLHIKIAYF